MVMIIVIYVIVMIVSLIVGNFWCSSSSGCFDFVVIILNITLVMSFFFDIDNIQRRFSKLSLSLSIYIYFFLLGSDPATQLMRFARDIRGSTCQLDMISLGRGREARTEETITKSFRHRGRWVFLQNCHLASSFMPRLKEIVRR